MNLSKDQLDNVTEYGKALTPVQDVAVLMDLDVDELREEFSCPKSPVRRAYEIGRARTEYEIRQTEINMAASGSPIAIQHVKGYLNDLILSNDQ